MQGCKKENVFEGAENRMFYIETHTKSRLLLPLLFLENKRFEELRKKETKIAGERIFPVR